MTVALFKSAWMPVLNICGRIFNNWAIHSLMVVHISPKIRYVKISPAATSSTLELNTSQVRPLSTI